MSGVLRALYICTHKRQMPTLRDITHPRYGTYAVDKPFTHNGRTWRIIGRDEGGYWLRNEDTGQRKQVSEEQLKQAEQ